MKYVNSKLVALFMYVVISCGYTNGQQLAPTSIKERLKMGTAKFVRSVVFSPDGNTLAVACGEERSPGEIRLYTVNDVKLIHTLKGHKDRVNCLAYLKSDLLLSGGRDNQCLVWSTSTHKLIGGLNGHNGEIADISVSRDGKQVYTASEDHTIMSWDLDKRQKIASIETQDTSIARLALSPNGELLAGGGIRGIDKGPVTIRIWETRTRKEIAQLKGHNDTITGLAFTPNGSQLASCGRDGRIILWDTKTWADITDVDLEKPDFPMSLSISQNGKCLTVGSWSGFVDFFNISKPANKWVLKKDVLQMRVRFWAHDLPITAVTYRPDRKMLASGSIDENVKLWVNVPEFE